MNVLPANLRGLRALSIRQPWADMIVHHTKRIENRSWPTKFRGEFLIHASSVCTWREYNEAVASAAPLLTGRLPGPRDLDRGGIVGVATLVDCVTEHESLWFVGEYGFVLDHVRALPFIPCRGMLGFFTPKL
jgi:hypothetical protein